jgi:N-acetylneuraminate synthase
MKPVYVIAEVGVNHNGDIGLARELVGAAAEAGANAVKFQTFVADKLASRHAPKATYQQRQSDAAESQVDMLRKLELPYQWHHELKACAQTYGIDFLSTAFDAQSLNFLETIQIPFYKVPSGELTNGPLLWQFARKRKPLVISTGMATLSEVELALAVVCHAFNSDDEPTHVDDVWRSWSSPTWRNSLNGRVTLLHCTSQYPAPFNEVNLKAMDTLANTFNLPVGYSDHTGDILISIAAVARGATLIEKHLTLDRNLPGPDHRASLEPDDFNRLVGGIRTVEVALGDGIKSVQPSEWDTRKAARQQVIVTREIQRGERFARADLSTARNGKGVHPADLWGLVGKSASRTYAASEPVDPS